MGMNKLKVVLIGIMLFLGEGLLLAEVMIEDLGVIRANKPAFVFLDQQDDSYRLNICSFAFGFGEVSTITNLRPEDGRYSSITPTVWSNITWPNHIERAPETVWGEGYFLVAGGFLVPGQSNGAITRLNLNGDKVELSPRKKGYFYHSTIWADMNGDGLVDVLTARASKLMFNAGKGELLWLEQPENPASFPWKEHIIGTGPDVNIIYEDLNGDGVNEIIATEFFAKKLTLWTRDHEKWISQLIDGFLGQGFSLEAVDLNGDGTKEILATNHESDSRAGVFAYEIPEDLTMPWKKHTLLTGIPTTSKGMKQASPGRAHAFFVSDEKKSKKPMILVSGDGSQKAHLLVPQNQNDPNHWGYSEQILLTVQKGVIGQSAVGDIDGDGMKEIFIPAYDQNEIHVMRIK